MRISPTSGLSQDEIERIIVEAHNSAEADKEMRDRLDLNNKLNSLIKNTQRAFTEFGGLLTKEQQESGQDIMTRGEEAVGSSEIGDIRIALDQVDRLARQLTAAMLESPSEPHSN